MFINNSEPITELYDSFSEQISKADIYAANLLSKISLSILKKRIEMHLTQKEFSRFMGVSRGMVSKWERGDNFTIETIAEICEKLAIIVDIVIEEEVYEKK
jgi:DNA-binding transcriptional regulator YiaG